MKTPNQPSPFDSSTHTPQKNAPKQGASQNSMPQNPMPSSPMQGALIEAGSIQNQRDAPAFYKHTNYLVRRKLMKLVGASFYVDDPNGNVILYANQKGFKLKEDIRLYTGEDMQTELLRIGARNWIDINAVYDVTDATNGQKVGSLKRMGLKSMIQDEWEIRDAQDRPMGIIKEDSMALALVRRFIEFAALLLPQKYSVQIGSRDVAHFTQNKNPMLIKLACDFAVDSEGVLDRRLALAAAVLLCAIEGKQR